MSLQVEYSPASLLRDRHLVKNPLTGLMERTVLLEGYSRTFLSASDTTGSPSNTNFITLTGSQPSPDGGTSAVRVQEDTVNVYHRVGFSPPVSTVGQVHSFAIAIKAAERGMIWFDANTNNGAPGGNPYFLNLATGGIENIGSTALSYLRVSPMGNGWWLLEISYTAASNYNVGIGALNAGATSYNGDGASGWLMWRPTFFVNQVAPSSQIYSAGNGLGYLTPTPSGSENSYGTGRYPDSALELPATGITSVPASMTMLAEFIEVGSRLVSGAGVVSLSAYDATGARLYISTGTSGYRLTHHNGTSAVFSELTAFPAPGDLVRLRAVFNANGSVQLYQSINGAVETSATASASNTPASAWGAQRIWLNGIGKTAPSFIAFRSALVQTGINTLPQMLALV